MRIPIEKLEVIEASKREPEQGPSHQKACQPMPAPVAIFLSCKEFPGA
jgi:hypothetical protein